MKKSEMIQEILGALEFVYPVQADVTMAEALLALIEARGMLPPPRETLFPYGNQKRLDKRGIKRMVADYTTLDMWEPEVEDRREERT